ncbi:unnamed protein product [Acanthoscelides obtectus]|nr:unnamed protein product [Acanthoscelides obtectus]CAK1677586.1 Eukaryotic translation initiation factor 2-alpha kinase 1 [Acanthoscelides obtectus]
MNHPNIVQYKGAWLEIGAPSHRAITDKPGHEDLHEANSNTKYIYNELQSFTEESYYFNKHEDTSTDFQIDFEHSISGANSIKSQRSINKRKKRHSLSEGEGDASMCKLDLKEIERIRTNNKSKVRWATLYIQMALCQTTLKQWLEKRNAMVTDPDKALVQGLRSDAVRQILIQLLSGLEYIHSKGVVHHDIKPSNIFIQVENNGIVIQLGDFGLACPLQSVRHSLAFGTKLYAAPEQLAGKCNPKSDMYSLGIVLFELVENFRTDMERVEYITELRKGHIPSKLFVTHPDMAQMIQSLVQKSPELRPDTTSLLHALKSTETQEIEQLKVQLAEKEEEISHLKELLTMHGIKGV